jgi:excisionase family DNA binding protein
MDEKLLTVEQVAIRLGFSIATIRRFIKQGAAGKKLKAIKMGREYRIRPSDLEEFIAQLSRAA